MTAESNAHKRKRGRPRAIEKNPAEAERDSWVRITLRLPDELHLELVQAAGEASLNATIVERLKKSFTDEGIKEMLQLSVAMSHKRLERVEKTVEEARREGLEEGRKQGLDELKIVIEQSIDSAIRNILKGKL